MNPTNTTTATWVTKDNGLNIEESITKVLCQLAAEMPYCSDEFAAEKWNELCDKWTSFGICLYNGMRSSADLLNRAIEVSAAAQTITRNRVKKEAAA